MLLIAPGASASHYLIADVPDVIEKGRHAALKEAGIVNTQQLYERIVRRKGRRSLAAMTRIPVRELAKWARFLDLMQLKGVGPQMVRLMKADAEALQSAMRVANRGGRYSEVVPAAGVVAGWIGAAKQIEARLE